MTAVSPLITILVPVKDEEDGIAPFVSRVSVILDGLNESEGWEILFVDDGSRDRTLAEVAVQHARDPRVRCISLSRNFGKEAALSAGLDHAAGQAVIPLDVDLQDPPEVIADMVRSWRDGFDVVYGVRRNRESDSIPKRLTADLYYRAHNYLSADKIPEHAGDFRLLDRKVVDVIRMMPERNRFMKGLFAWAGFRQTAVHYDRAEREVGTTKFNYWKLWTLALDGITSGSTLPLRVWSYLGGGVAFGTLLYAAYLVVRTVVRGGDVPGYPSLMVAILFFGSVQLISLGVLGEYVGRILVETKHRPIYVVRETIGVPIQPVTR
ncbi:glycosyltransferase family 2 protein [Sphingomonas sp. CGMCC 1.13654]|uniref:Glycosyltransferase family 2 protein n=1 Tax=Sphingomonas chungangi TaxID=2683589 RepID=A0A838L7S9_9SPHN|nr:glycosyltransferase family 2 protein [Sphingomonas chungangi]MBA2935371.1 glycosyltransferase family 2 protein [Sphingomonas chungangi]MVW56877.1 glycosyltransferase [Sphingomonas chungangi]